MRMMGGGNRSQGFTIVEVMIVTAITGLLLLGAIILVAGRQNNVEFTTGMQDIQSQIQQQISQVSDGFYSNLENNLSCSIPEVLTPSQVGNTIVPPLVSNPGVGSSYTRGANQDCVFMGVVLHFYGSSSTSWQQGDEMSVIPVIGKQCQSGSTTGSGGTTNPCVYPTNIYNANPVAVSPGKFGSTPSGYPYDYTSLPQAATNFTLDNGITVGQVCYQKTSCSVGGNSYCSFGLLSDPADTSDASGNLLAGSTPITLWGFGGHFCLAGNSSIDSPVAPSYTMQYLNYALDENNTGGVTSVFPPNNPITDVEVCFVSGTTTQSALLTIKSTTNNASPTSNSEQYGGSGVTTSLQIYGDKTC